MNSHEDTVAVEFSPSLVEVLDLNEDSGHLTLNLWIKMVGKKECKFKLENSCIDVILAIDVSRLGRMYLCGGVQAISMTFQSSMFQLTKSGFQILFSIMGIL